MKNRWRTIVTALGITVIFAALAARLVVLHTRPSPDTLAGIERGRHLEQRIRATRGRILDRNGQILAIDVTGYHIGVDPRFVFRHGDMEAVCDALSTHLLLDRAALAERLNRPESQYVPVQRFVRDQTASAIRDLRLRGIVFEETTLREYPKGALAAHVIGFVNHEGVGSAGIEQRMNSTMEGTPGLRVSQKDGRRREIYTRREVDVEPVPGNDVWLTIDQNIQHIVERALDALNEKHQPLATWAIVQDIRTGEILAMASLPTFNPDRFSQTPPEWMRNRAISYTFEPGSTMKVPVIAAALDLGLVRPVDMFDCERGLWTYAGRTLKDSHPYGLLSVADILKKSSNIGTAKIALRMGNDRLFQSLRSFGFSERSGIELPGDDAGILWPVRRWSRLSITRISMGHEVLVTALQQVSAFSTIANDGIRMRPYLIRQVTDSKGTVLSRAQPQEIGRPIRPETSLQMRRLLARATQPGGTGTRAAVRGYLVAGKTGTAQKVNLEEGGYFRNRYISSFAGFIPSETPMISIIVVADEPKNGYYGGTVCAPAFQAIAEQTVRYLRIPPEGTPIEFASGIEDAPEPATGDF